jgi:hypothetical protein
MSVDAKWVWLCDGSPELSESKKEECPQCPDRQTGWDTIFERPWTHWR